MQLLFFNVVRDPAGKSESSLISRFMTQSALTEVDGKTPTDLNGENIGPLLFH